MSFTVLNSAGATVTIQAIALGSGTQVMQSIPTNASGTAMIGSAVMASSLPIVVASDQPALPVNLASVGAAAFGLGQAIMAASLPVAIASNQSNLPASLQTGTAPIGTVSAIQIGTWAVNVTLLGGNAIATGGLSNAVGVGGLGSTGGAPRGYPVWIGAQAQTGEIATTTSGFLTPVVTDKVGKLINLPFANPENWVYGAGTTNSTAAFTLISSAAVNATTRFYVTACQLGNTSGTTFLATFNDTASTPLIVPAGGGSDLVFPTPLTFSLGSAVTIACSTAVATAVFAVQGYKGT